MTTCSSLQKSRQVSVRQATRQDIFCTADGTRNKQYSTSTQILKWSHITNFCDPFPVLSSDPTSIEWNHKVASAGVGLRAWSQCVAAFLLTYSQPTVYTAFICPTHSFTILCFYRFHSHIHNLVLLSLISPLELSILFVVLINISSSHQ